MDQKYRDMVDARLKSNSSEVFGNFSAEHAGYIIAQFVASAEKSIEILSGSFADSFYDGITIAPLLEQAAERIAQNGGRIRIITIDGCKCENLSMLVDEINQKITPERPVIEYIPAKCAEPSRINHFMVVDSARYRLEEPHPVCKKGETPTCVKAEVCCNGPVKAAGLVKDFNEIWDMLSA